MSEIKTPAQAARALTYKKETVYAKKDSAFIDEAYQYAKDYVKYLDASKTEREAVVASIALAEKNGFVPYAFGDEIKAGGRYYYNNRGKNIFLFAIGSESVANGIRISAAHIDSPRLDLKHIPLSS